MMRAGALLLVAICIALPAGCGDDGGDDPGTNEAPAAAEPQPDGGQTTQEEGREPSGGSRGTDGGTPEERRDASDLRGLLQQGGDAGEVEDVDVSRTSITVRTRLERSKSDARKASSLCATVRRFIAQRPARATVGTVTVAGRGAVVITRC